MKIVLFISCYFSKKLISVSFCHEDFEKHLLIKVNIKNFAEYICRQLKYHQQKISNTGLSLELIVNVFHAL